MTIHHLLGNRGGKRAHLQRVKKRLQAITELPTNMTCSDCPETQPTWASLLVPLVGGVDKKKQRIGVLCCFKCYSYHFQMGDSVCKVLNIKMVEEWSEDDIEAMERGGGNAIVNFIYEAHLCPSVYDKHTILDDPEADAAARKEFILHKYQHLRYFDASLYQMQVLLDAPKIPDAAVSAIKPKSVKTTTNKRSKSFDNACPPPKSGFRNAIKEFVKKPQRRRSQSFREHVDDGTDEDAMGMTYNLPGHLRVEKPLAAKKQQNSRGSSIPRSNNKAMRAPSAERKAAGQSHTEPSREDLGYGSMHGSSQCSHTIDNSQASQGMDGTSRISNRRRRSSVGSQYSDVSQGSRDSQTSDATPRRSNRRRRSSSGSLNIDVSQSSTSTDATARRNNRRRRSSVGKSTSSSNGGGVKRLPPRSTDCGECKSTAPRAPRRIVSDSSGEDTDAVTSNTTSSRAGCTSCSSRAPRPPIRILSDSSDTDSIGQASVCDSTAPRMPQRFLSDSSGEDSDAAKQARAGQTLSATLAATPGQVRRMSLPAFSRRLDDDEEEDSIVHQYSDKKYSGIDVYSPHGRRGSLGRERFDKTKLKYGVKMGYGFESSKSSDSEHETRSKRRPVRRGSTGDGLCAMDAPALGCFLETCTEQPKKILDEHSLSSGTKSSNDDIVGIGPCDKGSSNRVSAGAGPSSLTSHLQTSKNKLPIVPSLSDSSKSSDDSSDAHFKRRPSSSSLSDHFKEKESEIIASDNQSVGGFSLLSGLSGFSGFSAFTGFSFGSKSSKSSDEEDIKPTNTLASSKGSFAWATSFTVNTVEEAKISLAIPSPLDLGYGEDENLEDLLQAVPSKEILQRCKDPQPKQQTKGFRRRSSTRGALNMFASGIGQIEDLDTESRRRPRESIGLTGPVVQDTTWRRHVSPTKSAPQKAVAERDNTTTEARVRSQKNELRLKSDHLTPDGAQVKERDSSSREALHRGDLGFKPEAPSKEQLSYRDLDYDRSERSELSAKTRSSRTGNGTASRRPSSRAVDDTMSQSLCVSALRRRSSSSSTSSNSSYKSAQQGSSLGTTLGDSSTNVSAVRRRSSTSSSYKSASLGSSSGSMHSTSCRSTSGTLLRQDSSDSIATDASEESLNASTLYAGYFLPRKLTSSNKGGEEPPPPMDPLQSDESTSSSDSLHRSDRSNESSSVMIRPHRSSRLLASRQPCSLLS